MTDMVLMLQDNRELIGKEKMCKRQCIDTYYVATVVQVNSAKKISRHNQFLSVNMTVNMGTNNNR